MARSEDKWVQFEGVIEASSAKAVFFMADNWTEAAWLPRSQIEIISEDPDAVPKRFTINIKEWLVEKNGWER